MELGTCQQRVLQKKFKRKKSCTSKYVKKKFRHAFLVVFVYEQEFINKRKVDSLNLESFI